MCCTGPLGPTSTNAGARQKFKQHLSPLSLVKGCSRELSFHVDQRILEENRGRKGIMLEYETWLRPPWDNPSFHSQIRLAWVNTEKAE